MNEIQNIIDRHLGIYCRFNYDHVLKRLVVQDGESYYGLQNTNVVDIYDQNPPIFACRFAEASGYEHVLALANEDGRVAIQDTTTNKTAKMLEGFQCHNNAVFDLAWMPGHMNFVTVSGDHSACLWDVGGGSLRSVMVFSAHTRSVKTAVFRPPPASPAVFATGARDGHVLIWDTRAASQPAVIIKPDNWLANCHSGAPPKTPGSHGKRARIDARAVSITGLTFRDEITLLSCGECDGNIKVWDLRKNYTAFKREPLPKYSIPYCGSSTRNGYTNLIVDESHTRLYASCMDNVIYCFNVATYCALPERRYIGHENSTFYIKAGLSPDGAYLVSGSSDKHAYIWNIKHSLPVAKLTGHRAEVTCAAWCQRDDVKIVTCSDDARHMIWRVGPEFCAKDELRGWAEVVPKGESPPAWGTPSSLKRRASTTPTSHQSKRPRPERKTKRCLAALLEASKDTDDTEAAVKRLRLEPKEERSATKRPRETTPPPTWTYPPPRPGTSFMSPSKTYDPGSCRHLTPRKRKSESPKSPNKVRIVAFKTPTKDLPDYVMNGEAPHLRLMSPPIKKPDTTDWLTRLARSRRTEPKVPPQPLSPKETLPQRRNSSDKIPKSKSGTLLKYFTVAGKEM